VQRNVKWWVIGLLAVAAVVSVAARQAARTAATRFVRETPWAASGKWVRIDYHTHTRFSDGAHRVEAVVAKAAEYGCDAVAITDHADKDLEAATPGYFKAIATARKDNPGTVVLAGVEWNLPPRGGDDHAVLLVPSAAESLLAEFKARFDDLGRETHEEALALEALRWLAANAPPGARPVLLYEHPSRLDAQSIENARDVRVWRGVNDLVVGFAGAPGHQAASSIGSYEYKETPIDRWDPVTARVGDAWDTLLREGLDVWGASAPSDFHNTDLDYWPCQFSATWVQVPDRSVDGVLQGLRAGSYFGEHGHVVRRAGLEVSAPGLPRPATPGETIRAAAGSELAVTVTIDVPATDWKGEPNRIDSVEIVAIDAEGARIASSGPAKDGTFSATLTVPKGGLVIRARGRREVTGGPALMFHTNPVRVTTR
jgi:hypothetical protein